MAKKQLSMYDKIKKQNGERFAKAIRNYDNGIFDVPDIDKIVKYAGHDAEPIMQYLISLKNIQIQEQSVHMDPIKLLDMAGYDAYVADTLEKQNAIKKYYASGEEICTFDDPHRFENYFIINAVRKDVEKIQRDDFICPEREDAYGTSVISIQVLKGGGFISIKNRYNHTVMNPDNTFCSNPDNIIMGLSDAIKHYFDVDFSSHKVELPGRYIVVKNQIVKTNSEYNNLYVGSNFYVKNGVITELNTQYEYMIDWGIVLDMRTRTVRDITHRLPNLDFIQNEIKDKVLQIKYDKSSGQYALMADGRKVIGFKDGQMTYFAPTQRIRAYPSYRFHGVLDFSNVDILDLSEANLADVTSINFNPNAESILLKDVMGLSGDLDFSGVRYLCLDCSLGGVKSLKINSNAVMLDLNLYRYKGPRINLDFSNVNELEFKCADSMDISQIKFNPNAESINISFIRGLRGDLDFSGVKNFGGTDVDFTNVTSVRFNPNADVINLWGASGLRGDLDFSGVEKLLILGLDYSDIISIKFNPNGYVDDIVGHVIRRIKDCRAKKFNKAIQAVKKQNEGISNNENAPINQGNGNEKD